MKSKRTGSQFTHLRLYFYGQLSRAKFDQPLDSCFGFERIPLLLQRNQKVNIMETRDGADPINGSGLMFSFLNEATLQDTRMLVNKLVVIFSSLIKMTPQDRVGGGQ